MGIEKMRLPWVTQRHLARIYAAQRALAATHFCWRKARFYACLEFSIYNAAPRQLVRFYLLSLTFFQFARAVEFELEDLQDTLDHCDGRCEPGDFVIDGDPLLVRRHDGNDEYPIDLVILEPDTIIVTKDQNSRISWVNKNYGYVSDVPIADVIGKTPDQVLLDFQAAQIILAQDIAALTNGANLFRESIQVRGKTLDRIAIRFPLPPELQSKHGSIAVICFDLASALRFPRVEEARVCEFTSRKKELTSTPGAAAHTLPQALGER